VFMDEASDGEKAPLIDDDVDVLDNERADVGVPALRVLLPLPPPLITCCCWGYQDEDCELSPLPIRFGRKAAPPRGVWSYDA